MIYTFITILAWVVCVFSFLRITVTIFAPRSPKEKLLIEFIQRQGRNPYNEMLKGTYVLFVISLIWLMAGYVN